MEADIAKHIALDKCFIGRAVAEWDCDETACFLGDDKENSFNMTVGLDPSKDKFFLWLQLVVGVKPRPASRHSRQRSLFMLLQADMFDHDQEACLSLNPVTELSVPKETQEAIDRAHIRSDDTHMFQLHLRLKEGSQVVMPRSNPPLVLATEKGRCLLRLFRSLSEATSLSIYVPLRADRVQPLRDVCKRLLSKQLVNNDIDFESRYKGGAERDVWSNFDIFPVSASEQHVQKPDPLASKSTTNYWSRGCSFEGKSTQTVEEQPAPADPAPLPLYKKNDGSAALQPVPSPAPAPASLPVYQPDLDPDGEETEEDDATASPRSPPRKKRKADNDTTAAASPAPAPPSTHTSSPPQADAETEAAPLPPRPRNKQRVRSTTSAASRSSVRPHLTTTTTKANSTLPPRTISSHLNTTTASLRIALASFLRWLAAVDVDLQEKYDGLLWDMGDAAAAGDGVQFYRLQARCKADVLVGYRRRRDPLPEYQREE